MTTSYYGRLDGNKPNKPWTEWIMDDYLKKQCDKVIDKFKEQLQHTFNEIREDFKNDLFRVKKNIKAIEINMRAIEREIKPKDKK